MLNCTIAFWVEKVAQGKLIEHSINHVKIALVINAKMDVQNRKKNTHIRGGGGGKGYSTEIERKKNEK